MKLTITVISIVSLLGFSLYTIANSESPEIPDKQEFSAPEKINTDGESVFIFNPRTLRWYAYDGDGNLVKSGYGSGGRDYCDDIQEPCRTPEGIFYVDGLGDADCLSDEIPGKGRAPMPYCMHVTGDFSIHGYSNVPNYNASHGCIRVTPSEAKWLEDNVIDYGTKVIVLPY